MRNLVFALLLFCPLVWGHSQSPMRLEVNSGERSVIAVLTITNNFRFQDRYAIDCYRGERGYARIECQSIPESTILYPNASRRVKVKMPTDGDGIYRICSIEDPAENEERFVITRICTLVGVGVPPIPSPNVRPKHRATANAMATGSGSNPIR